MINATGPIQQEPYSQPPLPFRGEYSKLKIAALFALLVPIFLAWTALSLAAYIPIKLSNALGYHWNWGNSMIDECFDLWVGSARYFSKTDTFLPGEGKPILLVHGYLHNSTGWQDTIHTLQKAGCGPIYTIDLGDGTLSGKFWSIEDYAKQVGEKVHSIQKETGQASVALVGHSMGGVVSCLYAAKYAEPNTVSDVITVGSPMRGAPMADCIGEGADGHEMQTQSPFLEEVRHSVENTPGVRFYSVASKTDELVPFESALFENDPTRQMIVEDKGHMSLMTSKKVAQKIASWLKAN